MSMPVFAAQDRPRDVLDASGQWLAAQLGWRWVKSRSDIEIRRGSQLLRLGLQSSTWSRAGMGHREGGSPLFNLS
jgi:hypothetical protein